MRTMYFEGNIKKVILTMLLSKISKKAFGLNCSPVVLKNIETPPLPHDDWVRVKNIQTGICGTDMTFYTCAQSASMAIYPLPGSEITYLGHETVGIVSEKGSAVKNLNIGDRVILREYMACCDLKALPKDEWCDNCKKGEYTICANYGVQSRIKDMVGAGFGDSYMGPETQVIKIDDSISDDQAILIEPTAVSLHAVMKKIPAKGDKVLVIGAGMIGLNIVQIIKALQPECTVYILNRSKMKTDFALKLGADKAVQGNPYEYIASETGAKLYRKGKNTMLIGGMDIVYDTVGKHGMLDFGLRALRARGTYVKVGYQMTMTKFDETPIWWQELNIIGVDSYGMEEYNGEKIQSFDLVIKLLKEGKIKLDGFITDRYNLSDYKKAFNKMLFDSHNSIKIVVRTDSND